MIYIYWLTRVRSHIIVIYVRRHSLILALWIHTGEKPQWCNIYGKTFCRSSQLKVTTLPPTGLPIIREFLLGIFSSTTATYHRSFTFQWNEILQNANGVVCWVERLNHCTCIKIMFQLAWRFIGITCLSLSLTAIIMVIGWGMCQTCYVVVNYVSRTPVLLLCYWQ